jgi:hypothetical protein
MKFSQKTIEVLKNFSMFNPGIFIKPGKVIRTIGNDKDIVAEYVCDEKFEKKFGIYDLTSLLSVLSLQKDIPEIEIGDTAMKITNLSGRNTINYRFTSEEMILLPPEKNVQMPEAEINIELSADDLEIIKRSVNILSSPNISISSDGKKVYAKCFDVKTDSASTSELELADGDGSTYNMIFKEEAWKIIPGNYEISISTKGISHFKNKDINLQYWITTQPGSTYSSK